MTLDMVEAPTVQGGRPRKNRIERLDNKIVFDRVLGVNCSTPAVLDAWPHIGWLPGMVYLLHFNVPVGNLDTPHGAAKHYVGYTESVAERVERHLRGDGSPLVKAAVEAGGAITLARVWAGTRKDERRIKAQHNTPRFCPLCNTKILVQQPWRELRMARYEKNGAGYELVAGTYQAQFWVSDIRYQGMW